MCALFSAGAAPGASTGGRVADSSKNLIEFRAGKLNLRGTKVVPDKRKGTFYIHRERETMLTHVCWKDRTSGTVEDDLIVFPDDCEWKAVPQCTTGRVFLLKFLSSNKKLFFWMQEPKDTKDKEYSEKINKILNDPDDSSANDIFGGGAGTPEQLLSQMLGSGGGGAQEQIMQQLLQGGLLGPGLGGAGGLGRGQRTPSARATETPAAPGAPNPARARPPQNNSAIQLSDFQQMMTQLARPKSGESSGSLVNLAAGLPLDLTSLLSNDDARSRLQPHVPTDDELTPEAGTEVSGSLASPQFRQALSAFSLAFSSGQLGPVISQFNLGEEALAAANTGNMKSFVDALNKAAGVSPSPPGEEAGEDEEKKERGEEKKDGGDDEGKMETDDGDEKMETS